MNTLPVVSLTPSSSFFKFFHFPSLHRSLSHSPNFCFTKTLILNPNQLSFKSSLNSLSPSQSQLSEEYEEEDDDDEEEEDEEEEDDDEAADEYDNISDEIRNSDDDEETEFSVDLPTEESVRERVEFRWQRVEKLRSLVRDFGVEMIDIDELISIYDFRIDKFQVCFA